MKSQPIVGAALFNAVMAAAGYRCQCGLEFIRAKLFISFASSLQEAAQAKALRNAGASMTARAFVRRVWPESE